MRLIVAPRSAVSANCLGRGPAPCEAPTAAWKMPRSHARDGAPVGGRAKSVLLSSLDRRLSARTGRPSRSSSILEPQYCTLSHATTFGPNGCSPWAQTSELASLLTSSMLSRRPGLSKQMPVSRNELQARLDAGCTEALIGAGFSAQHRATLSLPQLMWVSREYLDAPVRIMFLGKESNGWIGGLRLDSYFDGRCTLERLHQRKRPANPS